MENYSQKYGTQTNYLGQANYYPQQTTSGVKCAWRPGMACNGACGARCRTR